MTQDSLVLEIDRYFNQNWICSVREKQTGQIAEKVVSSNEALAFCSANLLLGKGGGARI
jgi:hypothetical protein